MSDVELVIKIPEEDYERLIEYKKAPFCSLTSRIYEAVANGTPLKTGHWIYDYTTADGHRTYHCSECGRYLEPKHSERLNSFKWCSLCGAKMESEEPK